MEPAKRKAQIECMEKIIGECEDLGLTDLADCGRKHLSEAKQHLEQETIQM